MGALSALGGLIGQMGSCYAQDICSLLGSINPGYRRRAVIVCFKLFKRAATY